MALTSGYSIGYLSFTIFLLIFSGVLLFAIDVKTYKKKSMTREFKASRFMGWLNIALGIIAFIVNWVYQRIL
jgi:uncharacterized membrane protein